MNGPDRDAFLEAHLSLVRRVFSRLRVGIPPRVAEQMEDDLLGAGMIGLIQAYDRFDSRNSASFSTFASHRIRGAMLDELRRHDWLSKQSRQRMKEIQRAWSACEQELGRNASDEEVAVKLGVTPAALRQEYVDIGPATLVFLEGLGQEPGDWRNFIPDPLSSTPEDLQVRKQIQERLADAIGHLPDQEQTVLRCLLHDELGQAEIAELLGISASRVSQIYSKAVLRLQLALKPVFE